MSILDSARRLYNGLPLVRELRLLQGAAATSDATRARIAQEEFVANLLRQDRYAQTRRLNRFEHQVFSQNGEDGIIREIFQRIGASDRSFLEIGVGNGQVNNTTFLLSQGWRGWWLEGNERSVAAIRRSFAGPLSAGRLSLLHAFATAETIADSLRRLGVSREIDLLSVDVDRNNYWILARVLDVLRPRVAVVEYNATWPADVDWKVEYVADRWWNRTAYFGASLKAYETLCRGHGLALVGCDLHGLNGFFVREDLCGDRFETPYTAESHYEPARYFLIRTHGHPPCFTDLESDAAAGGAPSPLG
jgi:hypothetical protein